MDDATPARTITLTFAPDPFLLRVVRLAASSMANDVGFTITELDDLTLAIDELTAALLDVATGEVQVTITSHDGGVTVEGVASAADDAIELGPMATLIIQRTTDEFLVDADRDRPGYRMTKHRATVG